MVNKQSIGQNSGNHGFIMQDGIACPRKPPWDPKVSKITGLPFILILILGIYILFQAGIPKLIIWLIAYSIFTYPLRYLICARCLYYGMDCSSGFGKLVPKMFKKQEGKTMQLGLWLDVLFFAFLFVYPLLYIWRKGFLFIIVWCGAFLLAFIVLTRLACSICPFTFCPIGKGGRAFWELFNTTKKPNQYEA